MIAAVAMNGFGANVVSRGEWALASRAGVPNERTTLEGVGKTTADLRAAARAAADGRPLRWIAIESPEEAEALAEEAAKVDARMDVLYRLNPDVAPETLTGLAVGAGGTKFGMTETEIASAITAGGGPDGRLRPRGIHLHVGSQLGAVDAWRDAVRKALALAALWRGSIGSFDTVDLGGGFPIGPAGEPSPSPGGSLGNSSRCSTRSRMIDARRVSPSSRAGPWWRAPGGSSRGCSTSATGRADRWSSTPA